MFVWTIVCFYLGSHLKLKSHSFSFNEILKIRICLPSSVFLQVRVNTSFTLCFKFPFVFHSPSFPVTGPTFPLTTLSCFVAPPFLYAKVSPCSSSVMPFTVHSLLLRPSGTDSLEQFIVFPGIFECLQLLPSMTSERTNLSPLGHHCAVHRPHIHRSHSHSHFFSKAKSYFLLTTRLKHCRKPLLVNQVVYTHSFYKKT